MKLGDSWSFTFSQGKPRYVVKNFFFYYLFRFAAALGQEIFYITFLPSTYWNFDPYVTRRLVAVWAVSTSTFRYYFSVTVTSRILQGNHNVFFSIGFGVATIL